MRWFVFLLLAVAGTAAEAQVCVGGRCLLPRRPSVVVSAPATVVEAAPAAVTVVAPEARRVVVHGGAQAHAEHCAATGRFVHATNFGTGYEGIGWGSSPEAATRACCYWNRRPVREIGTAYCQQRRQWFACVRYD